MNKRKYLYPILAVIFWIGVWEIVARGVDLSFALPGPLPTLLAFCRLLATPSFWQTVLFSLIRIFLGFLLGVLAAIPLAALTIRFPLADALISPAMTVIKSTPVASFIMVLWIMIGSAYVPTAIALLMVAPLIWQNLCQGWRALDRDLGEVLTVYKVPPHRRFAIYVLPTVAPYFRSACLSGIGLSWKAGIAAEIIAYTKNSIGRRIGDAKNYFEGAEMFAWTLSVILLSLLLEFVMRRIVARRKQHGNI